MIKEILENNDQIEMIDYLDQLNENDKSLLENDINKYDITALNKIYKDSYNDDEYDIDKYSPLTIMDKSNIYSNIGEEIIKNNEYAVVLLAGGNASRLGLNLPKGCLELNIHNKKTSLFEIYINQLKDAYDKYNSYINLYIMTNDSNYNDTYNYFEKNNYFSYPKDKIHFFIQDNLPILNIEGKLLLETNNKLLVGPNGNGNVFKALKKANYIDHMTSNNIKYVLFLTIDNIFNKLVDTAMIGAMVNGNFPVSTKTITKTNIEDKGWVFAKYNNKPSMIHSSYITDDITNKKVNNEYVYRETNITYHIVNINELKKYADIELPYHRNYKKYDYMDYNGNNIIADTNNSFKFEQFLFDAFSYSDDMLLYRVGLDEFHPIKKEEDILIAEEFFNQEKRD